MKARDQDLKERLTVLQVWSILKSFENVHISHEKLKISKSEDNSTAFLCSMEQTSSLNLDYGLWKQLILSSDIGSISYYRKTLLI